MEKYLSINPYNRGETYYYWYDSKLISLDNVIKIENKIMNIAANNNWILFKVYPLQTTYSTLYLNDKGKKNIIIGLN